MGLRKNLMAIAKLVPPIRRVALQRDTLAAEVRALWREKKALQISGVVIPSESSPKPDSHAYDAGDMARVSASRPSRDGAQELLYFAVLNGALEDFDSWKDRALSFQGKPLILDNIYGCLQGIDAAEIGREMTVTCDTRTWHRTRVLMYALAKALKLHPVLLWNRPDRAVRGIGLSDSENYAWVLGSLFDYTNTYFHQEPRLDICADALPYSGLDFIVSTDVFEHVVPPVEKAFRNCHRMLKPGGVLVFSVPYGANQAETVEHFPSLHEWHLEDRVTAGGGKETVLVNVDARGEQEVFDKLCFHGGQGETLEMRAFGKGHLLELAAKTGFEVEAIVAEDVPLFGIWNHGNLNSLPMVFRKR